MSSKAKIFDRPPKSTTEAIAIISNPDVLPPAGVRLSDYHFVRCARSNLDGATLASRYPYDFAPNKTPVPTRVNCGHAFIKEGPLGPSRRSHYVILFGKYQMIGAQGLKAGLSSTKPGHVSINSDLGLGDVCKEGPMLFKSTDSEDEEDGPEEDAAGARKGEDRGAAETSEDSDGDDDDDEEDSESTTENSAGDISDEEEDVGTGGKHDEDSLQVSSRASSSSSSSSSKTPPAVRPSRPRESAPAKRKALSSVSGSGHRSKKPRYTGTDLFPTVTKLEREIISIQDSLSDSTMAASAIITRNLSTSAKLKQVLAELQGLKEPKKKRSRVTVRPIPGEMSRRIRWKRGTRRK